MDLRGRNAAIALTAGAASPRVLVAPLDLADQRSVAHFIDQWAGPLHILINNVGDGRCDRPLSRIVQRPSSSAAVGITPMGSPRTRSMPSNAERLWHESTRMLRRSL